MVSGDILYLDLGDKKCAKLEYSLGDITMPTIIISNGYGEFGLERPVYRQFKELINQLKFNWVHYLYPERINPKENQSLLISGGVRTLDFIYSWLKNKEYTKIGLFGVSFGANISLEFNMLRKVEFSILINTPIDYYQFRLNQLGYKDFSELEKRDVMVNYPDFNVCMTYEFIEEALKQDLSERMVKIRSPVLSFQAEEDRYIDVQDSQNTFSRLPTCQFLRVPWASHRFTEQPAINFLSLRILSFLQDRSF
jgi:hypothetical protein